MLSQLDNIIFPDRCDVLEIVPSQRYIYPIFKNASSSLYSSGFRTVDMVELADIKNIEVLVRNPFERFISGVQTYIDNLDPNLDRTTVLHFIENNLFLNRHFCPQFHWLVNLKRFTDADITIKPLHYVGTITTEHKNVSTVDTDLVEYFENNDKVYFYLEVDKVLINNLLGKTVSFKDIVGTIKTEYPSVYQEVIQRSIDLCNVLD
jgi:hypothetical protein